MEEFKSNSNASKENQQNDIPAPKNAPVTTNVTAINKKKFSFGNFFAADAKTVGQHVVETILVPSLQKLLSDSVKGAIDWFIYGSKGKSNPTYGPGTVSYSRYYQTPMYGNPLYYQNNGPMPNNQAPMQRPGVYSINDFKFQDRGDAEAVLMRMNEAIGRYGMVSVADFYDFIGQRCSFTDQKYGWYDLRAAQVIRYDDGFSIQFPKAQPIE